MREPARFEHTAELGKRRADVKGRMSPIVFNMLGYARASGRMPAAKLDSLVADLKQSLEDGTFVLILPQFLVTGSA